jgi:GT2 family glycosyltransferase
VAELQPAARPAVSVIVPFAGSADELSRLASELARLSLRPGDELIIADNRGDAATDARGGARIVDATGIRTPGFARNIGARCASGEWLVFIDADTSPSPTLLDDYFDPPARSLTGVLAGAIRDTAPTGAAVARHSANRAHLSQETTLRREHPYAQTANCAMRRAAFERVGGFDPNARAGEDAELCFRLRAAGFEIEERPRALVEHHSRRTLPALIGQLARHGSGAAWANRRFPGSFPPPSPAQLGRRFARDLVQAGRALAHRDSEAAMSAVLDLSGGLAFELGRLLPNRRASRRHTSGRGS